MLGPSQYDPIMPRTKRSLVDRFWDRVTKSDGCWVWTGPDAGNGYGIIGRGGRRGGNAYVHRLSYEIHRGPIPKGMQVCHTCDVRRCVNPDHFFLGDHKANMRDAIAKGRIDTRGAGNAMATTTMEQAKEVLRRGAAGERAPAISRSMGISVGVVRRIINGTRWKVLDSERATLRIVEEMA